MCIIVKLSINRLHILMSQLRNVIKCSMAWFQSFKNILVRLFSEAFIDMLKRGPVAAVLVLVYLPWHQSSFEQLRAAEPLWSHPRTLVISVLGWDQSGSELFGSALKCQSKQSLYYLHLRFLLAPPLPRWMFSFPSYKRKHSKKLGIQHKSKYFLSVVVRKNRRILSTFHL